MSAPTDDYMSAPAELDTARIRRGRKFDQVLEGARVIFMRDGFEGSSVDEIAREAGVSKATLYSYFPDKSLLFMAVAKYECDRQACATVAEIDISALSVREVLEMTARHLVMHMTSDFGRDIFRIGVAEAERFPRLGQEFYSSGPQVVHEKLGEYLREATERGELCIDDPGFAADQFAELCKAGIHLRLVLGLIDSVSEAEKARTINGAVDMFLARYARHD